MTETLYNGTKARILVTEDYDARADSEEFDFGITEEARGVAFYDVEELRDGEWWTYAALAAPLFDTKLRTAAAMEALRLADEAEAL